MNSTSRIHTTGRLANRRVHASGTSSSIWEKDAPAQGMVEFAIVLPILLLIIFGIIAFGHFFFSYSLVVAASREAARFGAAVGLTENSLPRYRDCNMIREAAVNSGKFAGVDGTDATIQISYDQGPRLDGTTVVYEAIDPVSGLNAPVGCPVDGVGPGFIELGDRIVVTVTTNYEPFVPMVPMDDMVLTATTRRTIMLGMPVGEVPIAEQSACVGTLTRIIPPLNSWNNQLLGSTSLVGQDITFQYEVIADDPDETAQGHIYFYVDDVLYATAVCDAAAPISSCELTFMNVTPLDADPLKPHILRAKYDPQGFSTGTPCYDPSKAEPLRHFVLPADTTLTILSFDPSPSIVGDAVVVTVEVLPVAPAGGTPLGPVYVEEKSGKQCKIDLMEFAEGVARGSCTLVLDQEGKTTIAATYDPGDPGENPNYNTSSAAAEHQVGKDPNPNPITNCPMFAPAVINFTTRPDAMFIPLQNMNEFIDIPVDNVTVSWPSAEVYPQSISFNTFEVWVAPAYPPPLSSPYSAAVSYTLPKALPGPVLTNLIVGFTGDLPAGMYSVTVSFAPPNELPELNCPDLLVTGTK